MRYILLGCVYFGLQWPVAVIAADNLGRYSIHGAGLLECKVFVEERNKQSPAYMMIGGWMDGYITAVNKLEDDTYDITAYTTTELLAVVINKHCSGRPDDLLAPVLDAILAELHAGRVKARSPLVEVRVGDFQTRLYAKTVSDIQARLVAKKFSTQEPTAAWNEETRTALARYQQAAELEPTGFPDQKTLWHLFQSQPR